MKIKATLQTPTKTYDLHGVIMTEHGIEIDPVEVDSLFGTHVEVCDGDLGCLALWQPGNHGEPDCHILYDANLHEE